MEEREMTHADLLVNLARAGTRGERPEFQKTLEELIAYERKKQHHVLANRLECYLKRDEPNISNVTPLYRNNITSNLYFEVEPIRRIDNLILSDENSAVCRELIEEQNRADLLRSYSLEPRHRILLAGPPGNGKTTLAEAIAFELTLPLLIVRYESIITSLLGETVLNMSKLFEQVRTRQCVLFFDEFDVVGKERGDIHDTGEIKRVVSSLLLQVDALPSYVVVVTATNHPELLDRAVWRRFQIRLNLPNPTLEQTKAWLLRLEDRLGEKLGVPIDDLAEDLKRANFSELERFGEDIQRRQVLSPPKTNIRRIILDRLIQWKTRFTLDSIKNDKEID
jgi:SpoVK/Ycf46/Vps4 family AAA+-type ATPase